MKRLLVGAAVLGLAVAGSGYATAGTDDGQGAQKSPLSAVTTDMDEQCESSESEDAEVGDASGFAILNAPGKSGETDRVVGQVSLKKAEPEQTYMVFLAMDGMCMPTGTLTTNVQGNGNSHIDAMGMGGTYYVVLQDMDMTERYASAPVLLR